jgi:DNA-binding PadR family transcriptional regulator
MQRYADVMSARENKGSARSVAANAAPADQILSLSNREAQILDMLIQKTPMYAQQMVDASGGELGRGTVYVTLNRMEDKGYVTSWQEDQAPGAVGLPRRLYKVTGLGSTVLREWGRMRTRLRLAVQGVS